MLGRIVLFCALALPALPALAEGVRYDQVDFSSSAEQQVSNDLMTAELNVEVNAARPDEVAREISGKLNAALKTAAAFTEIKAASGKQFVRPVYGKDAIRPKGWRGRAAIRLESRDFTAMARLIAELQQSMQLQDIRFALSPQTQEQVENALIGKAIAAFRRRAKNIAVALGARDYKLVHLSINRGGGYVRPMLARKAVPEQQFAGGESTMTVQASGTIEVVR